MARQKEIVVSTERINCYDFRVLTAGIDRKDFDHNPVMLWNHCRSWGSKDDILPIGHWEDLRVEGEKLIGVPNFDSEDEFAAKIERKYINGTIRAASIGIKNIEVSEAPELLLPGQRRGTVTKCKLEEISICDIPANADAVTLYDDNNKVIDLNKDNSFIKLINNSKNLNAMETETSKAQLEAKDAEIARLTAENKALETEKAQLKTQANEDYLTNAVKQKKISEAEKINFAKLMATDPETVKAIIDAREAKPETITTTTNPSFVTRISEQLKQLSDKRADWNYEKWMREDPAGLQLMKISNPAQFEELQKTFPQTNH